MAKSKVFDLIGCWAKLFQFLLTVVQKHRFSAAQHIFLHIATI